MLRDRIPAGRWVAEAECPGGLCQAASTHILGLAREGPTPTRFLLESRTESLSRRDRRPVPRIDPGESGKMTGVVRGDRDDVARVGPQNRLRCEDCISVERRRVGCRQPRGSDCRPEFGCLVERDLSYRVKLEAGADRVEPTESQCFAGPDQLAPQLVICDPRDDKSSTSRQERLRPLAACQGVRPRSRMGQQPQGSRIEDHQPHESNRGRSDNRSSSTTRTR